MWLDPGPGCAYSLVVLVAIGCASCLYGLWKFSELIAGVLTNAL